MRIDVQFAAPLPEAITAIVFAEFDGLIEIDQYRNVKMNTLELQIYLDRCNDNKRAEMLVCAIDQLEGKKLNSAKEYGFVVNLSRSTEAGSHWVGLYINRKRDVSM